MLWSTRESENTQHPVKPFILKLQWTSTTITTEDSPLKKKKKKKLSAPFAFLIVPFEFSRQDVLHTLENGLVLSWTF